MEASEVLRDVAQQATQCTRCQLHLSRKHAVPGEGPTHASVMLIGEGPGFYENEQGRPFVGPSGQYLDELLQKGGVERADVFITNVVKCRPPGNRDPQPAELAACAEYLDRQIAAINPQVIITLGRYSMAKFLPNVRISDVHGRPSWIRGRLIVPVYHPAAALRQFTMKTALESDFERLPEWVAQGLRRAGQAAVVADAASASPVAVPETLSLFSQPSLGDEWFDGTSAADEAEAAPPNPADDEANDPPEPQQMSLF